MEFYHFNLQHILWRKKEHEIVIEKVLRKLEMNEEIQVEEMWKKMNKFNYVYSTLQMELNWWQLWNNFFLYSCSKCHSNVVKVCLKNRIEVKVGACLTGWYYRIFIVRSYRKFSQSFPFNTYVSYITHLFCSISKYPSWIENKLLGSLTFVKDFRNVNELVNPSLNNG